MKKLILASLSCGAAMALLTEVGRAHGGTYRGPGDVVPPAPGGGRGGGPGGPTTGGPGGPSTPAPGGPATPGPAAPGTGGPAGPAGSRGPTTGGRGAQIDEDLTRWEFWWEFNKDPFIRLKDSIHSSSVTSGGDNFFLGATRKVESKDSLKPSDQDKIEVILPALKKAIDSTDQRDIASSCMIAMAKIGKDHPTEFKLADVFEPRIAKSDQEISETAALAYGIAGIPHESTVDLLVGLATDNDLGRKKSDRSQVNDRTRAFATYGLGLLAYLNSDLELKKNVFAALKKVVDDDKASSRNLKVAAVNAIGILNIGTDDEKGRALVKDALATLDGYYQKNLGPGEQLMQAHVPTSVAKLLGSNFYDAKVVDAYKKLFADDLSEKGKSKRNSNDIARSCVLALGQLCSPCDDAKAADAEYCQLLLDTWKGHKDLQTRYFSILALGQIGGKLNREHLLKEFDKANRSIEKPWVAMAMGVYAFEKYDEAKKKQQMPEIETAFGEALREGLSIKDPGTQSGLAVALGLVQYKAAADDLRSLLNQNKRKEDVAGYLCIGLALMNDERSEPDIRAIVQESTRKPDLLQQAAVALGKLGDKGVADDLQKMLAAETDGNLAKLSAIAGAIGFIGDRRSIDPLKRMLTNSQLSDLSRAFAAVALGGVGDKEPLPWNSKIGANINYRAAVETLTDKATGILDIL